MGRTLSTSATPAVRFRPSLSRLPELAAARLMRRSGVISLTLHATLLATLLVWFGRGGQLVIDTPDTLPAVELVMVEQQGKGQTSAPPVPTPKPDETATAAPPPAPPAPEAPPMPNAPPAPPPPAATEQPTEAVAVPPPPAPAPPAASQPTTAAPPQHAAPPAPPASAALDINLGGTDSETNAIASGANIIPASQDTSYHNREPIYPPEAVRRAQQGAVIVVAHVTPDGLASGVDVLSSSGYVSLDRAAHDAVATWHFLPAVKDGQAIPFDMKLRVVFQLN